MFLAADLVLHVKLCLSEDCALHESSVHIYYVCDLSWAGFILVLVEQVSKWTSSWGCLVSRCFKSSSIKHHADKNMLRIMESLRDKGKRSKTNGPWAVAKKELPSSSSGRLKRALFWLIWMWNVLTSHVGVHKIRFCTGRSHALKKPGYLGKSGYANQRKHFSPTTTLFLKHYLLFVCVCVCVHMCVCRSLQWENRLCSEITHTHTWQECG